MQASYLICGISLALATTPVHARETREGHIGVGSGVVIGALAGGPVGAVLGAGLGAWIGDKFHDGRALPGVAAERDAALGNLDGARTDLAATRTTLALSEKQRRDLEGSLRATEAQLNALAQARAPALGHGLELDVLFRTGQSELPADVQQRLSELASVLAASPDLRVQLDGHADPRGDDDYNRTLSNKRVQSVKDLLVAGGVDPARIEWEAHGETDSRATAGDLDAYALERLVRIRLGSEAAPAQTTTATVADSL
jgi:outer membrane protein OmpA-like peptidoglycan-associated protein